MEDQANYIAEVEEAFEMLGKGYEDQPSVVVEPPRRRIERRGKQMMEVEEAAFVKFSTEFKTELADLDVYALKVFIYIGLSINFETGTAYPGVRKIATDTKMNKDTVAKAITELEEKGFLEVKRRDGASNIYKPECYFAIGETVPSGRTPHELSDAGAKLSDENAKLSDGSRVKMHNQINKTLKPDEEEVGRNPLFSFYENNIGMLTTKIADDIEEAEKVYGFDWVTDVILMAGKNRAGHFNYCKPILERWKREGREEKKSFGRNGKATAAQSNDRSIYIKGEYADYIEH